MGILGTLTGQTCGDACWHAREETCRCSCGGANHGILNHGGETPERTSRIAGRVFVVAGIAPGYLATRDVMVDMADYPNYDKYAWPKQEVVITRKATASQLKWPEVMAITASNPRWPDDKYIVWKLAKGEPYPMDTAADKSKRASAHDALHDALIAERNAKEGGI